MGKKGFLGRLFVLWLPAFGGAARERKELAGLMKELRKDKAGFYTPLSNRLTEAFASELKSLAETAERLLPLYRCTIAGTKEEKRRAETRIINEAMKTFGMDLSSLTFASLKAEVFDKGGKGIRGMDDIFKSRVAVLHNEIFKEYSLGYNVNLRIADLCAFDFAALLDPFHPKDGRSGKLGGCDASLVVENLLDLFFLVDTLVIGDSAFTVLATLSEEPAADDLERLKVLISEAFEAGRLSAIIRCIKGNPALAPGRGLDEVDLVQGIAAGIVDEYKRERHAFIQSQTEMEFQSMLNALFGNLILTKMDGYTSEISNLLYNANLGEYRFIEPMNILKSFFVLFYQPIIRPTLAFLYAEAEFGDLDFMEELRKAEEDTESTDHAIFKFEEDLALSSFSKIKPVIEQVTSASLEPGMRAKAGLLIHGINVDADRIIQKCFADLTQLHVCITKLLIDAGMPTPLLLRNAAILSSNNGKLMASMENSTSLIEKELRLLRTFAVDMNAFRSGLVKRAAN